MYGQQERLMNEFSHPLKFVNGRTNRILLFLSIGEPFAGHVGLHQFVICRDLQVGGHGAGSPGILKSSEQFEWRCPGEQASLAR